jgi:demethylmenaquinone methyltransferase/2-methoxy-6-polyprenyl-1,4-benzoquinol methylase
LTNTSNSNLKDTSADQGLGVSSESLAALNNAIAAEASMHKFWNDYAEHYSLLRESRVYEQLMQQTLTLARIEAGVQCLDLACGPGNYVLEMAKKASNVVGVDYSEKMIAIAQNKLCQSITLNKKISLIQMDVLDYIKTVPDNFFDVVISALLLSYVKQADEIVSEIYRILKPGGRFVMSNPRPDANFTQV